MRGFGTLTSIRLCSGQALGTLRGAKHSIARGASPKFSNFVLSQFIRDYIDLSVMYFLPTIEGRIAKIKEF